MLVISQQHCASGTGRQRLSLIEWTQQLRVGIVIQATLLL